MPVITSGGNATGTFGTTDSITITTRGSAKFECPTGTVIAGEFSGSRTFGPYTGQTYKVTANTGDALYEVGDGVIPPTQDQINALVSEAGTITAAELATTTGTTGQTVRLSDGDDRGAILMWSTPDGASAETWCWWLWPQSAYEA